MKDRRTPEALGDRRFAAGLEIGCSISVLPRMLASRSEALLGVDLVEQPPAAARARCADQSWVRLRRMQVPAAWPSERLDLSVLSEVLYFLAPADIDRTARLAYGSLLRGARVVLVNWLGQSDDPCTGDEAADRFIAAAADALRVTRQPRHRLDLLESVRRQRRPRKYDAGAKLTLSPVSRRSGCEA